MRGDGPDAPVRLRDALPQLPQRRPLRLACREHPVAHEAPLRALLEDALQRDPLGRLALRLIEPDAGSIRFEGEDLRALSAAGLRARRREMQLIFQDPFASLDPRMTVEAAIAARLAARAALQPARAARSVSLPAASRSSAGGRNRSP